MNHWEIVLSVILVATLAVTIYYAAKAVRQIRKENQRRAFDQEHGNFDEQDQVGGGFDE
jgi:hypothetical protein